MKSTVMLLAMGVSVSLSSVFSAAFAGSAVLALRQGSDGGLNFNTTEFTITNTSSAGVLLNGMTLTIGDTRYNFDELYNRAPVFEEHFLPAGVSPLPTATLLIGSRDQDNTPAHVTDLFQYALTDFTPGSSFVGQFDIDPDDQTTVADARFILFNNGNLSNAVLTLDFSDGQVVYTFPDLPVLQEYTDILVPTPLAVPEPTAMAGATLCFSLLALRRKR